MNKIIIFMLIPSVLSSLVAPVLAFEELGDASLESMEKPSPYVPGTTIQWLKNGKALSVLYETMDEETYTAKDSDGCTWTSMTSMFAPDSMWTNCDGRSGTHEIIETRGNPWPLSHETMFQYEFTGKWSDGLDGTWRSTRKCEVIEKVRVKVSAGEYDTYKLVCEDKWIKRTYWVSPKLSHSVAYEREHKTMGVAQANWFDIEQSYRLELLKIVTP